jgi:hypothetical protein
LAFAAFLIDHLIPWFCSHVVGRHNKVRATIPPPITTTTKWAAQQSGWRSNVRDTTKPVTRWLRRESVCVHERLELSWVNPTHDSRNNNKKTRAHSPDHGGELHDLLPQLLHISMHRTRDATLCGLLVFFSSHVLSESLALLVSVSMATPLRI